MSRPKSTLPTVDEAIARMEVEDRAVNMLDGDPHVTAIHAVKLAGFTAECWLDVAVARCSQEPRWHTCSVSSLRDMLAGLQPDEAAHVAYCVAQWAYRRAGFK